MFSFNYNNQDKYEHVFLENIMNITNYTNQFITINGKKIVYSNEKENIIVASSDDVYNLLHQSYDYLLKKYNNNQQILDDIFKSVEGLKNLTDYNYKIFDLLDYINIEINNNKINKVYDFYSDELNTHQLTDDSDYESVEHSVSRNSKEEFEIEQKENIKDEHKLEPQLEKSVLKIIPSNDNIITKEDIKNLELEDEFIDDEYENVYNDKINSIIEDNNAINDDIIIDIDSSDIKNNNNECMITRRIKSSELSNNDIIGDYDDNTDEKIKDILSVSYKRRVSTKIQKFLVSSATSSKDDCTYCIKYNKKEHTHNKHKHSSSSDNIDDNEKKNQLTFNIVKNNIKNKLKSWYSSLKQCVKDIPIGFSDCFSDMTCICCSHDITVEEDAPPPVRQEMTDIENQIR